MKIFGLIAVLCVSLAFISCGEGSSSGQPETEKLTKPEVKPPPGPPPRKLVIIDLEEGTGPGAKTEDTLTVQYVGVDKEGKELYSSWTKRHAPLTFTLNGGAYFIGWEKGLEGMKEGGRRELHIPGYLAAGEPLFYIVDLLKIK